LTTVFALALFSSAAPDYAGEPDRPPRPQVCSVAGGRPARCVEVAPVAEGSLRILRGGACAGGALAPDDPSVAAETPDLRRPNVATAGAERERKGDLQPTTIERIQLMLGALGLNPGVPDGRLGDETREALRAYQLRKGLPVTGRASEDLISALDADFLHCVVWSPLARSEETRPRAADECPAAKARAR
jgi:hypothetical protein